MNKASQKRIKNSSKKQPAKKAVVKKKQRIENIILPLDMLEEIERMVDDAKDGNVADIAISLTVQEIENKHFNELKVTMASVHGQCTTEWSASHQAHSA